MAKKKTESTPSSTPKATSAAASPAAKKPAAPAASASVSSPMIDTSRAANIAAAMVTGKSPAASTDAAGGPKKESAAFKQLKAGLNKQSTGSLGGAFAMPKQNKKQSQNFGGGKQIGHNQTFGADVNRAGVPRRTPG